MLGKCLVPFFKINTKQQNNKKIRIKTKATNKCEQQKKEQKRKKNMKLKFFLFQEFITRMHTARVCVCLHIYFLFVYVFLPFFKPTLTTPLIFRIVELCMNLSVQQDKWLMHRKLKNMHLISKQINVQR